MADSWALSQLDAFWKSYSQLAGEIAWARAQLEDTQYQLTRARERAERGERTGGADVAYWLQAEARWVSFLAQLEGRNEKDEAGTSVR